MRRIGNLYGHIADYENLLAAFHAAARGKRDRAEVQEFARHLPDRIGRLRDELLAETVHLGNYHYFLIHDPKQRRICAAEFRERVLHHAVINVVGLYLERPLIDHTFACRKGKGQLRAARFAQDCARRFPFFLKMDIRKYFDSIAHATVRDQLGRLFKDPALLRFFDRLLDTYETRQGHGLPIGNLTSQYLANLYLSTFDHYVKQVLRCRAYVRYMDDLLLFGARHEVNSWQESGAAFLAEELGLEVKNGGFTNRTAHGCDFCGYRVLPIRLGLARHAARRMRRKWMVLERAYTMHGIGALELQSRAAALFAFAETADSGVFRRNLARASILGERA